MKLKLLELFGGIGACSKALERLGIDFEIVDYVEIDKYAVKSFNAIHGTNFEPQDICNWDKEIEVDLIMHGSPCQDFSLAGKQAGGDKGSGTRSSLMYETLRIVNKLKPKYVIWENVKNLISKKHIHNFNAYLDSMEKMGYRNYYKVLNAKDFGIPQNRERVFTVSILGKSNFNFPKGKICINNIKRLYGLYGQRTRWGIYDKKGIAPTLTASMGLGGGHIPMLEIKNFKFPEKQKLELKLVNFLDKTIKKQKKEFEIDKTVKPSVAKNIDREKEKLINSDSDIYNLDCTSGWQDNKVGINISPTIRANNNNTYILEKDFEFPKEQKLELKLKDILDDEVDEKYYLDDKKIDMISKWNCYEKPLKKVCGRNSIVGTITTRSGAECGGMKTYCDSFDDTTDLEEIKIISGSYARDFGSKGKLQNDTCNTLTASMGTGGGNIPLVKVIKENKNE